jgi:hypothetical protein
MKAGSYILVFKDSTGRTRTMTCDTVEDVRTWFNRLTMYDQDQYTKAQNVFVTQVLGTAQEFLVRQP